MVRQEFEWKTSGYEIDKGMNNLSRNFESTGIFCRKWPKELQVTPTELLQQPAIPRKNLRKFTYLSVSTSKVRHLQSQARK